ncbi:DUF362 domain-containing protein [Blautia producta]|uniref:DUF362 domain-containing protein n=1 Tax=Blautia producta TaxID=33035 RepID=UPI0031B58B0F
MENNEILMIHGKDYKEMTKRLLKDAGLDARIPDRRCRIGIKPNLVSPTAASYGATTHPEIIAGIVEYLQERNYENLVILEGSWVGDRTAEAFRVCGYESLAEQYGVELLDTQKDSTTSCDCEGMELQICDSALALDFLINVPVLKGHCQTKITCALKNMKGLIPNKEKRHFHAMGLHKPIAHLNTVLHQDFIVVDNICGDLDFEDGGNPVVMDRILAAADPVLCDTYVCHLLKYETEEVPYIKMAEKLGVGSADLSGIVLRTCNEQEHSVHVPAGRKIVELQDAVEEVESCSACYGYLIPALDKLKEEGLFGKLKTKICIGQGFQGKEGELGIGSCTRCFRHTLKGCPPTENQIYEFLKNYIEEQE